jgi:putative ABC transport system ATP-binding protein
MTPAAPPVIALSDVVCRPGEASNFELAVGDFVVDRGEAVAIVGPSGSGKSTFMNMLALAARPDHIGGFALWMRDGRGIDIGALWATENDDRLTAIRSRCMGYVLQQGGLLPYLSVRRNIELGLLIQKRSDPGHVVEIARELEIDGLLDRLPATLSVGQRQRVAIARALVHRPELLLADEPTASVHPSLADSVLKLLVDQARLNDSALVLVTHDGDRAARHGFSIVPLLGERGHSERSLLSRQKMAA